MYKNGEDTISIAEATSSADLLGLSVENWANEYGWSLEGKTTVLGETTPPTEPVKETAAGDSSLADTSLESPSFEQGRYIQINGRIITEDEYMSNFAGKKTGKGNYPDTFDKYAKAYNVGIQTEAMSPVLQTATVTAEAGQQVKDDRAAATNLDRELAKDNEFTHREEIAVNYFNLQDSNGDGFYTPKVQREQYFPEIPNSGGRKSGFAEFKNDFETDLRLSLGEEKYNKWKELQEISGGEVSKDKLLEFYNSLEIDQQFVGDIVNAKKVKTAEISMRDYSEEEQDRIQRYRGSEELQEKKQAVFVEGVQDERDYESLTGRKLITPQTVKGRTYTPTSYINYKDLLKEEQSNLADEFKDIKLQNEELENSWAEILNIQTGFQERVKALDKEIEMRPATSSSSAEDIERYNQLITERNNIISSDEYNNYLDNWEALAANTEAYKSRVDSAIEKNKELLDQKVGQDAALKAYDSLTRLAIVWEEFTIGSLAGIAGVVSEVGRDMAVNPAVAYQFEESRRVAVNYNKRLEDKRKRMLPQNLSYSDLKSGGSGWDYFTEGLINNSPSIILAMAPTSVAGIGLKGAARLKAITKAGKLVGGVFGVAEAGGYLRETDLSMANAEDNIAMLQNQLEETQGTIARDEIKSKIEAQQNLLGLSTMQRAFNAASYGAIAMYSERLGSIGFLADFGKYSKSIGYENILKLTKGKEGISRVLASNLGTAKGVIAGVGVEEIEESVTQIGQNLMDIAVAGEDKSLLEGLDVDFFLNVGISSLGMTGPKVGSNLYNSIASEFKTAKDIKANKELADELINIQTQLDGDKLSKEQRTLLRLARRNLVESIAITDAKQLMRVKQLDQADVLEVAEIERKKRALVKQARVLGGGQLEVGVRGELETLNEKYKNLEAQREAILGKPDKKIAELTADAANPTEAAFNLANYLFNIDIARAAGKDVNVVEDASDIDNLNLTKAQKDEVRAAFGDGKTVGANAIIVAGKVIVFENNIIQRINQVSGMEGAIAAVSPLHEVGHQQAIAQGLIKDDRLVGDAKAVINGITTEVSGLAAAGKITKAQFNNFIKRVELYKTSDGVNVDELIQLVADFTNAGVLPKSSYSKLWELKGFVNRAMEIAYPDADLFFKVNSSSDVFNFVSSWTKKAMEGQRLAAPEQDEEAKLSKPLLDEINALVPESVQTQEQFFDRKVFNPIYNDGKLHPAIANYIRSRSVSKEEAQKIIESVGDRLINFNPEAKRKSGDAKITLGEFIFSNVNFGKLDARKALFEEGQERAQTESTDSETAKQVVAREESTIAAEDKPTYKTLTKRRVLSEDAKSVAEAKVLSNVRVLKSRIDAKVGKNVTVTPLIAEIKKTLGKQLDIDFKKEMGGKKDGQLRKYLLRNKAAILENMTTTWLMTAMPNAVQKQVDGVWTSDWKGKKIDREAVSTDSAGRTSGAELVRRLPKAATRLSDADYLSNILDASGAPIRGRKESLAKAMAEQYAIEIIRDGVADPSSEIGKAFLDNQARKGVEVTETIAVEFNRQAEQGNVKFSLGLGTVIEYLENPKFNINLGNNREKGINKLLILHGKDAIYKLDSVEDIDSWAENTTKYVLPLLPKDIFFSKDAKGNYKESGSSAFRRSNRFVGNKSLDDYFIGKINEMRALPESSFASPIKGLGKKFSPSYDTNIGKDDKAMQANIDNGQVEQFNNYWGTIHRVMWQNINKTIRANPDNKNVLKAIGNYMSNVSNDKSHPHKMGAGFVGYSMDATGKTSDKGTFRKYEWEHAMPATNAYLYLLDASINGFDFNAAYNAVMANYKLIALDTAQDLKIKAAGLSNGMPIGWKLTENNWTERYSESGVDLNTIMTTSGITLQQAINSRNANQFNSEINTKALEKAKKDIAAVESSKLSKPLENNPLSREFNNILERKTGVEAFKTFSAVQAQKRGEKKGRFKFFIAPSVDDFRGLVNYAFAGKGKQGEADMKWLEDNLMTPYAKGIAAINGIRQQIKRDFKTAVKAFPKQYQLLNKEIGKTGFTYDQAVRVYLWGKAGIKVPGLSQKDTKILQDAIRENPELMDFADAMLVVARRDTWMEPSEHWSASTLLSDLNSMTEKIGRKKYLEEFIANADAIFTEENLNKIEALYGRAHRDAIVDALYSMKNGTNRNAGGNKQVNAWLNWINGSTGAIMFFNRRSALLQMLSTVNFINYSDNNPLKAAAAFANQKQYWTDWAMIFNSDKLKERRGGLKQDVSSNEIASIANANKNSPQAILARLLQLGFTPTQIADSMAIASGGATFYRNRVNTYLKKGMTQKEAEQQAFLDFSKISDETQQSSDPALVSQVQRSNLGRLVFAFQNTPMQMTRLMKKDALDIINGRGDWRVKVARITYYGAIQNFIFSSLQSALFAMLPGFDDDDEDLTAAELDKKNAKEEAKIARVLNSMLDTLLRGSGVYGAVFSTVKNTIREYNKQEEKGFMSDHAYTVLSLFNISPPISSKARKVHSAIQTRKFEKDEIAARGWGVVADGRLDLGPNWTILGKVLSAAVSVPLDRVVDELTSISEAFDARNKAWQRIALALGWKTWDVGAIEENAEAIKAAAKKKRKEAGTKKAKETRRKNKPKKIKARKKKEQELELMTPAEMTEYLNKNK
jgi:hypothetical protein